MTTARLEMLPINAIELDKENPRIKHFLEMYTDITSEMIALALTDSSSGDTSTSYRALRDSIKVILFGLLPGGRRNANFLFPCRCF